MENNMFNNFLETENKKTFMNLIIGAGSVMDIFPVSHNYFGNKLKLGDFRNDTTALSKDWNCIGRDIKNALMTFQPNPNL
jgi:hypothetical protein